MNYLKKIPLKYKGELHNIRLINFTVDYSEINYLLPAPLKARDFGGKAMISMVDVELKKMHMDSFPSALNFNYRHVAFRLLIEDAALNGSASKGIFFLKSFATSPFIVLGGKLLTYYNLSQAKIKNRLDSVVITQGKQRIVYQRDDKPSMESDEILSLKNTIGAIDRAYSVEKGDIYVTQIIREKWPIEPVECAFFENTFFESSEFQGAFRVNETINYEWLPPTKVNYSDRFPRPSDLSVPQVIEFLI